MLPVPREQLVEPYLRDIGDAGEHIGQPSQWINVVELGRHDQRGHCRGTVGAALGTSEEP